MKTDAGSSASAAAYSLAWVDAAWEDLQRGVEEARRAHGGEAGHEVSAGEVAMAPPAMPVEAILVLSTEGSRVSDVTLVAASPTTSEILLSLLDSLTIDRGPRVADAEEAGPSDLPGGLLGDEIIIEPPLLGGSDDLVRAAPDPLIWGGPTLAWMSAEGDPYFVLDDLEEREF